ncbi:MAG: hypothetical protein Fur0018_09520 [Anaerolineales bacterium]
MLDPTIPILGSRTLIWIVAQLHLNFAAFILGAPLFIVMAEYLGYRWKDPRWERLAHEMTHVTAFAYSLTALMGGFFIFVMVGLYADFSSYIFPRFFPVWVALYPFLFITETILIYTYNYAWHHWNGSKKRRHLTIGVLLNIVGTLTMFTQNSIASFMNTPPENWETASVWQLMNNPTWWPINLHRFIANITFGGFITALVAAFMYLSAKSREDKEFYDWMGFIGTGIGIITFALLAVPGYIFGREIYAYDASLGLYLMSDRLSMFFEMQGLLIGLGYLIANYYIWLSVRRIEGGERFARWFKIGFGLIFLGSAIWVTPRHWFATMVPDPGVQLDVNALELPSHLGFLALMPAKNAAAAWTILVTFFNYFLYRKAISKGKIEWGKIEIPSQYALILQGFIAIWTMGLMGAVRSLMRKSYHVYNAIPDLTQFSYTPTLAYSSLVTTIVTLIFFGLIAFMIWLALKVYRGGAAANEETGGTSDVAVA